MQLSALVSELTSRGYHVTRAEVTPGGNVLVVFDLLKGARSPSWLKGVELPPDMATPDAVELAMQAWQVSVLSGIALGKASPIVRKMMEVHGADAVMDVLKPRFANAA